jgi:hypothetical protein
MNGINRGLLAAVAVAAVAVLATACGSSAPSASSALGGSVTYAQTVALAQCMRSHGLPDFPDPDSSGDFNLTTQSGDNQAVDPDSSQFETAYTACRHLLAGGGPSVAKLQQAAQQEQQALAQALPALLKYSQCMRSHGLPTFPNPTADGMSLNKSSGINPSSPQFQAATNACQHVLPAGMHLNAGSSSSSKNP